jgi:hypothetical protein
MGISSDYMSIIWINMKKLVRTEKHDCTESMMFCVRGIIPNWAALGDSRIRFVFRHFWVKF